MGRLRRNELSRIFRVEKAHSEIVSKGTLFKALKYIDSAEGMDTPVLLLDRDKLREKASLIGSRIEGSRVFYAVKAHPDLEVLRFFDSLGLGFEIASEGELGILVELGVKPERIITSNPMKSPKFLSMAASYGVSHYAFDSRAEVEKMSELAPGSRVYLRLSVPNEGSEWPLSRKYGVELDQALELLMYARDEGLHPVGITFHVGSQCTNMFNWNNAIYKARQLWEMAASEGMGLSVLNIGGGYPINYTKGVVAIDAIEKNIDSLINDNFPERPEVFLEPGRSFVGDAGIFVATVIGKAPRLDENWLYMDVGVFNGLMESVGGIRYSYVVEDNRKEAEKKHYVICGPSCDSFDVIDKEVRLPEPDVGDMILILSAGAYTISYASEFNGFSIPRTILI
jgi:ornithine decarboxylase